MAVLFKVLHMVCVYIDDVLVMTNHNYKYHLNALETFLQRLAEVGIKVNSDNVFFGQIDTEYIYFWVYNNGVRQLSYIVDAS